MQKILSFLDLAYYLNSIQEDFEKITKAGAFTIDESQSFDFSQADPITRLYATNFFRTILLGHVDHE